MDIMTWLDTPQAWSYTWCWLIPVSFLGFVVMLLVQTPLAKMFKMSAGMGIAFSVVLILAVSFGAATYMTQFWTCRASLKQFAA